MEPLEDSVLGQSKVPSKHVANTAEGLTVFGQKRPDLLLGNALEYTDTNDIFIITSIIYDRPMGLRPQISSVVLERLSDKVQGKRKLAQLEALIEGGKFTFKPSRDDKRPCRKVDITDAEVTFYIVDTPSDIDTLRITPDQIEKL